MNTTGNDYHRQAAGVRERIWIKGTLVLTRPTSLSNGDSEGLTDIDIRRDVVSGQPVLPGSSLAGALRGYLIQRLGNVATEKLFGAITEIDPSKSSQKSEESGDVGGQQSRTPTPSSEQKKIRISAQSWLWVDDAFGTEPGIEIRDGVAIDPKTRTAADKKKFNLELLPAGTTFALGFEFWVPEENGEPFRETLAQALMGLGQGEISLGGRKRRGFGECKVEEWQVYRYDMHTPAGVLGWLEMDRSRPAEGNTVAEMLGVKELPALPAPNYCTLKATFDLETSLLIRAGAANTAGPDMVHLRNFAQEPILSGTSVAGALRARAGRIARLLRPAESANALINCVFGQEMTEKAQVQPKASRLWVRETVVQGAVADRVQSRVKIDRFTGGSYPGALFDQQPLFRGKVTLDLKLEQPRCEEVGLLLLLLKDLWVGDLPLGGEVSVGRGRLQGQEAELSWNAQTWTITRDGERLKITGEMQPLEDAVRALAGKTPATEVAQ